ncbi:protein At-4/1-like [Quercus lobata]|uniref:protein At-4/1-like n=1 Tax=Quercus lobata TaxID=97700 RepID=UPI001244ED0F|nr:protein At-4/1-like [Quercus lobata]
MVGSSNEEEMELVLLPNFDLIYQDFKNAITEIELLKTNSNAELKIREALQFTSHSLRQENERLTRLQSESLYTLADQRTKCQSLKELNRVSDERLHQEYEHKKSMDLLKRDYMTMVGVGGSNPMKRYMLQLTMAK